MKNHLTQSSNFIVRFRVKGTMSKTSFPFLLNNSITLCPRVFINYRIKDSLSKWPLLFWGSLGQISCRRRALWPKVFQFRSMIGLLVMSVFGSLCQRSRSQDCQSSRWHLLRLMSYTDYYFLMSIYHNIRQQYKKDVPITLRIIYSLHLSSRVYKSI